MDEGFATCKCGNPAKVLTANGYLCLTCLRRRDGKSESFIELQRPEDEMNNRRKKK